MKNIDGTYKWYAEDGSIEIEDKIAISTKDKKAFTGTYTETYINGSISEVAKFVDGKRDGETLYYYDNGQIKERISYIKGLKEGDYSYFNKKGEVIGKGVFLMIREKDNGLFMMKKIKH